MLSCSEMIDLGSHQLKGQGHYRRHKAPPSKSPPDNDWQGFKPMRHRYKKILKYNDTGKL